MIRLERVTLLIVSVALTVSAQGMPRASKADAWESLYNKKRLRIQWDVLPPHAPVELPDGKTESARAPWPFVLLVTKVDSKAKRRLLRNVVNDTRFVVMTHAVRPIEIKPESVVGIPYLSGVQGVRDPTVIVVNRDFEVVGSIHRAKEFEAKLVLPMLLKAARRDYETKISRYVGRFIKLLRAEEEIWAQERQVEALRERAIKSLAKGDEPKSKELDTKADALQRETELARLDLEDKETALRATLVLKRTKVAPVPSTVRDGKRIRPLTRSEKEAIASFRSFARNKDPIVRAAAVEDLGAIDSAAMVEVILKAATDLDPRVTRAAGRALAHMRSKEAIRAIRAALDQPSLKVRLAALLALGHSSVPCPSAVPSIVPLSKAADPELRRAAILALEGQEGATSVDALIEALDDAEPGLRVLAAHALGVRRAAVGVPALLARLSGFDWPLRKAAVEALGRIRTKESVAPLIERLGVERGLVREVVHTALAAITGQDFGVRVDAWWVWWTKYGESFRVPTEREIQAARVRAENALDGYAKPGKRRYHKIKMRSRRMVFLIDISSSMRNKIVLPADATEALRAEFPSRVKIDIAKRALISLLADLEPHVRFNIITFAGQVKAWQKGLVPGTLKNRAIKYVSQIEPIEPVRSSGRRGRLAAADERQKTNTYGALLAGLGLADSATPSWRRVRTEADTVLLVTDGLPTTGKIVEATKLVDAITELNRTRGVIIHVILFDKDAARKLGPLATRNGGTCVVRGLETR